MFGNIGPMELGIILLIVIRFSASAGCWIGQFSVLVNCIACLQ